MIPRASLRTRVGGVKGGFVALLALLVATGAARADWWLLPEGRALPDLGAQRWRPDLFAGKGLRTMGAAALHLRRALLETSVLPPWLRLETRSEERRVGKECRSRW